MTHSSSRTKIIGFLILVAVLFFLIMLNVIYNSNKINNSKQELNKLELESLKYCINNFKECEVYHCFYGVVSETETKIYALELENNCLLRGKTK